MEKFDVIVVGGGPAGATAARETARAGLKTLLLEREKLPREKRCGGGVSNAALKELDFDLPESVVERECFGMWGIQEDILTEVRVTRRVATMVTRAAFDAFLVEKAREAGARINEGNACLGVRRDSGGVAVETERGVFSAELVLGCDGVFSTVAKSVRPAWTRGELRFCLVADVPLSKELIDNKMRNLVELRYGYIKQGYAWAFPKRTHISFGIGGSARQAKTLKASFASYLRLHHIDDEARVKGCFIPITAFAHDVVADRIMLCGDAAGFVDSFNGEGIHYAVASGKMAGRAAVRAFERKDLSKRALLDYQREFYGKYRRDIEWSTRVTKLSSRFPRLVFGPLLADRGIILRYFDVMSGDAHFADFARRIILRLPWIIVRHFVFRGGKAKTITEGPITP